MIVCAAILTLLSTAQANPTPVGGQPIAHQYALRMTHTGVNLHGCLRHSDAAVGNFDQDGRKKAIDCVHDLMREIAGEACAT